MKDFGKLIKERRLELDMSLEDVATKLGVNRSTIFRWENGADSRVNRAELLLLSKVLYMPIETLLGVKGKEIEDAEVVKTRLNVIDTLDDVKRKEDLEQIDKYIKVFFVNK